MPFNNITSKKAIVRVFWQHRVLYALWQNNVLTAYNGSPFANGSLSGLRLDPQQAQLLPPCEPTKIAAIGLNYPLHAGEMSKQVPDEPLIFLKPASSVIGPGAGIVLPAVSQRVDHEAELGIVIGKSCFQANERQALDYVLGYTCLNDVTARDLQAKDGQYTRAKSFDTFCPIGPAIALDVNPAAVGIYCLVNDETRQQGNTSDMIFNVARIVAHVSQVMTLNPGDVIATGTPPGISQLAKGDIVRVEIEGIGCLQNSCV